MSEKEDRYEHINLIVKKPADGSWFDIISDLISHDCQGGGGDCIVELDDDSDCGDHEHTEILPCTCGLESLGGSEGTLQQCYDDDQNVGSGLKIIDLARAIQDMSTTHSWKPETYKAIDWARKEIEFEEWFDVDDDAG